MNNELGDALRRAREKRGLSLHQVAVALKISHQAVQQWEVGKTVPKAKYLIAVADLYGVDVEALSGGAVGREIINMVSEGFEPQTTFVDRRPDRGDREIIPGAVQLADARRLRRLATEARESPLDVPVLGIAVGGDDADFSFNGQVINYVRRPVGVLRARGVYALHVVNDSMSPKFESGELIFVAPSRSPAAGDYVVAELKPPPDNPDAPGPAYVKRFKKRSGSFVLLEQFNPPAELKFPWNDIKAFHRVIPLNELLLGV
jgi:phage repressor protein C with HTH and peptisase S24 domain/DNA-binding XRE family transcriptional regulator